MADGLYDPTWVSTYFDNFADQEWDRLARSPTREVQYEMHRLILFGHVSPGQKVLEIGAGPGKFTRDLVDHGCRVTVTDISPVQIELNKAKAEELGFAHGVDAWIELDVCDLSTFTDASFDSIVAYGGPLSYVLERRDIAISECRRVLRPGGKALFGVMSLFGTIHEYLHGVLGIPREDNQRIIASGDLTKGSSDFATHYCHMFRSAELRKFLESHELPVVDMCASNVLSAVYGERLDEIRADESKWTELLEMEFLACREPGCLDCGTHLIAVAQK